MDRFAKLGVRTFWIVAIIVYCISIAMEYFLFRSMECGYNAESAVRARHTLLFLIAGGWGFWRAAFHPVFDRKYARWLDTMPWAHGKRIPLRRYLIGWQDILMLVVLVAADFAIERESLWQIPIAMATGYLLVSFVPLAICRMYATLYVYGLALVAFLLLWPATPYIAAVLTLCYLVVMPSLRRSAHELIWSPDQPDAEPLSLNRLRNYRHDLVIQYQTIGFPYNVLAKTPKDVGLTLPHMVGITILLGLLAYALRKPFLESANPGDPSAAVMIVAFMAAGRWLLYASRGSSPISLLGRVTTGRFIIPGYDKVLLGPLLGAAGGIAVFFSLRYYQFDHTITDAAAIATTMFILMIAPPNLRAWTLTGHHRAGALVVQETMAEKI